MTWVDRFCTQGFLRVEGAVPEAFARALGERAWRRVEAGHEAIEELERGRVTPSQLAAVRRAEPGTWPVPRLTVRGDEGGRIAEDWPLVWRVASALCGGADRLRTTGWGDYVIVNLDRARRSEGAPGTNPDHPAEHWHWDDPQAAATLDSQRLALVLLILLDDVAPGEGATRLAVGSHRVLARRLAEGPLDLEDLAVRAEVLAASEGHVEAHGRAGDAYFVHPLLLHGPGTAERARVRLLANPNLFVDALDLRSDPSPSPVEFAVRAALSEDAAGPAYDPAAEVLDALAFGDPIRAIECAEKVDGESAAASVARALVAALRGDADAAWEAMATQVARTALPPDALVGFASALQQSARARPVAEDRLARGADPHAPLPEDLVRALVLVEDPDAALVDRACAEAEDAPQLRAALDLLDAHGRAAEARALLRSRREVALEDAELAARALDLLLAQPALEEASALAEAIEERFATVHASRGRAAVAWLRGDAEAAAQAIAEALDRDPHDPVARTWAAEFAWHRGAREEALAHRAVALRRGLSFPLDVLRALFDARDGVRFDGPGPFVARYPWLCAENLASFEEVRDFARWVQDADARAKTLAAVLEALRGCRHRVPRGVPLVPPARLQADAALKCLSTHGLDEARRRLDALVAERPDSPHPRCYRGELRLWSGDDDAALEDFEAALAIAPTRWAHVGRGAVHLLQGGYEAAAAAFDQAETFGPVPGATTHVYRGELLRRLGQAEDARAELRRSLEGRPGRVGAWMQLAMLGDDDALEEVRRRAPAVLVLGARDAGRPVPVAAGDVGAVEVLEASLRRMRGNRSSSQCTTVDDAGRLRVHVPADRIRQVARSLSEFEGAAATRGGWATARAIAKDLVRAPDLPAPLPVADLQLLAVQRAERGLDLVVGRASPLGLLRLELRDRRVRSRAIVPPHLEPSLREAIDGLATRLARGVRPESLRRNLERAQSLPIYRVPL